MNIHYIYHRCNQQDSQKPTNSNKLVSIHRNFGPCGCGHGLYHQLSKCWWFPQICGRPLEAVSPLAQYKRASDHAQMVGIICDM